MISSATIAAFQAMQDQQNIVELFNGQPQKPQLQNIEQSQQQLPMGRQGAIKDVKSIIEDYRQRHPETVPRRGRRMKTVLTSSPSSSNHSNNGGSVVKINNNNNIGNNVDGGGVSRFNVKVNAGGLSITSSIPEWQQLMFNNLSRPSSADSTHSNNSSFASNSIFLQNSIKPSTISTSEYSPSTVEVKVGAGASAPTAGNVFG